MGAEIPNFSRRLRRNQPDKSSTPAYSPDCVPSVRGNGALQWPEISAVCGLDLDYRQQLYITIRSMRRHMQSLLQPFPQPFDNSAATMHTTVKGH